MHDHAQLAGSELDWPLLAGVPDLGGHGLACLSDVQIAAGAQGGPGVGQEHVTVTDAGFLSIAAGQDLHQQQAVVGKRRRRLVAGRHKSWITQP